MGCGSSEPQEIQQTPKPVAQEKEKNKQPPVKPGIPIVKGTFKETEATTKVLTLGAGECGKTTLWRQFKIIYCGGFTNAERSNLSNALKTNVLADIIALIQNAQSNNQNIPSDIQSDVEAILACDAVNADDFTEDIAESVSRVWADPIIKQVYQQANSIGIGENANYFLDNVERIAKDDYTPTNEDILKARIRTVGIFNLCFEVGEKKTKTVLVDVGGQRNERKNWSSCFQNVTYVMFVVSLSDFDQKMFEDENTTRTADSIELFKNIASTPAFEKVPFFLILNKFDIFQKKIKKNPQAFIEAYPGFTGDVKDENQCIDHIKQTFMKHLPLRDPEAFIEAIPTCAMDENSVSSLFQKIAKRIDERNQ
jgi:guanine nucleotide-binding protein G(i) subunit alpha